MKKAGSFIWDILKVVIVALIITMVVRTYLFAAVKVDGDSMDPTLYSGEYLFINKLKKADLFDIVFFHVPDNESAEYIKRVIGLPGDKLEYKDDTLYINGKKYEEPYLDEFKKQESSALTPNFVIEKIPEGKYFLMGDNRRVSNDSRYFGAVNESTIDGVVIKWGKKNL